MATIDENLATIRTAVYGRDMRQAIYEALTYLTNINRPSLYIKDALAGFPEYSLHNIGEYVSENSTLYGASPYFLIPTESFNHKVDGLLIWKNGGELVRKAWYTFDTNSAPGYTKIVFNLYEYFEETDSVIFSIYKNTLVYPCTQAEYDSMQTHNPLTLYTTVNNNGKVRQFFGDVELKSGTSTSGTAYQLLSGTNTGYNAGVSESEE